MRISNLRIEDRNDGRSYLTVDVECGFSESTSLWFSVDRKYKNWLTDDVYDAFLITSLYPAQFYGEKIQIEGNVSPHIYHNVVNYVPAIITAYNETKSLTKEDIQVDGLKTAFQSEEARIGTGFSGGVDSFSTIHDHLLHEADESRRLNTIFFFNIGQNGKIDDPDTQKRVAIRWEIARKVSEELRIEAVMMDSNIFEFYKPHWEYDAGIFCRIASILVFQRNLKRYYVSSALSYSESYHMTGNGRHIDMTSMCELYIVGMLSSEKCEIFLDGAQYYRSDKVRMITDLPIAHKYLNVCVNYDPKFLTENCGECTKCLRTALSLEILGKLDLFSSVFDVAKIRKILPNYLKYQMGLTDTDPFAADNIALAKKTGYTLPGAIDMAAYKTRRFLRHLILSLKYRLNLNR